MAGRYGDVEYTVLTKRGFLLGVALFAIGALGELGADRHRDRGARLGASTAV